MPVKVLAPVVPPLPNPPYFSNASQSSSSGSPTPTQPSILFQWQSKFLPRLSHPYPTLHTFPMTVKDLAPVVPPLLNPPYFSNASQSSCSGSPTPTYFSNASQSSCSGSPTPTQPSILFQWQSKFLPWLSHPYSTLHTFPMPVKVLAPVVPPLPNPPYFSNGSQSSCPGCPTPTQPSILFQ